MTEAVERDLDLPGRPTLHLREWPGDGPGLLLLHGFMGSARDWGDLPAALGDLHVVALDLPGHGRSGGGRTPAECAVPELVDMLAELQARLFPRPAAWLGYSMGARIALAAAVEGVPGTALLLESGSPGLDDPEVRAARRALDEARAHRIETVGMDAFVSEWLEMPLFAGLREAPPEVAAAARRIRAGQDPSRMAAWLRGAGTGTQPALWRRLEEVDRPVHILVGMKDRKFVDVAGKMAQFLHRVAIREVAGAGHTVHLEAPAAWLGWVRAALSQPLDSPPPERRAP